MFGVKKIKIMLFVLGLLMAVSSVGAWANSGIEWHSLR